MAIRSDIVATLTPRETGTFFFSKMVSLADAEQANITVRSSLDVDVSVDVVAARSDAPSEFARHSTIQESVTVPMNQDVAVYNLAWDGWYLWVGVAVVITSAPTTGKLELSADIRTVKNA